MMVRLEGVRGLCGCYQADQLEDMDMHGQGLHAVVF